MRIVASGASRYFSVMKFIFTPSIAKALLSGFSLILLGVCAPLNIADAAQPRVVAGKIVSNDWSFADDSPLEIGGEWEVVWGKLLEPNEFDQHYQGDYFLLPSRWNDVDSPYLDNSFGVATFRVRLRLPEYDKSVAYHMIAAHSAYRLYINGESAVANGVVSNKAQDVQANHVSRKFQGLSGDSEIVMQVANFTHAYGGPGHALLLWDELELNRFLDTISIIYGLVASILFAIGLFHLILCLADRGDQNSAIHLWFSILCFIIVYRVQGVIPLMHEYFANTEYWSDLRFTYVSLYAAPAVYLLFFRAVFREQFPNRLTLLVVFIALVGLLLTLFSEEIVYTSTRNFSIWLNVFAIAYSLIFTAVAVREKQPGSMVILAANFVFLITAIYDAIIYTDQSTGFDSTPFGILVLGIGYSYALFLRLQKTFQEARANSEALEQLNLDLEEQVHQRTRALQSATAKAEDSVRDKARFIAAASHDLRQPLHALSLFNNALKRKLKLSDAASLIEQQESAISNLGSLLQDTLDTAQLDSRNKPLNLGSIEISDIRDNLLDSFADKAMSRGLALSVEVDPQSLLPEDNDSGTVVTDVMMLQRVLGNLLDNALKAAQRSIQIRIDKINNRWRFQISDDGPGIAAKDIERIFDSYVSLQDQSSGETGGYGLGLYIVKEFTQALGGEIEVDSDSGKGARFTLLLPALNSLIQNDHAVPRSDARLTVLNDVKVLAVDDELIVLQAMAALLMGWMCDVKLAKDTETALAVLDHFTPDLLLVDYHLQGQSGIDLMQKLEQKIKQPIPTIVITGATEPSILDKIKQQGVRVLEKPVNPDELADAIIQKLVK